MALKISCFYFGCHGNWLGGLLKIGTKSYSGSSYTLKMVFYDNISPDNDDQIVLIYLIHHSLFNEINDEHLRLVVSMVTRMKHAKMGHFEHF